MNTAAEPTPGVDLDRLAGLLSEIAALCLKADRICYFSEPDDEAERRELSLMQCRELALRAGWLADLGASELGRVRKIGDAEDWLRSPGVRGRSGSKSARAGGVQ